MDFLLIDSILSFTGSQLNAYIQKLGWTIDPSTSVVAIPPNPDNQIEATIVQESVKLPRTSIIPYSKACSNPSCRARKNYCTFCRKNITLCSLDNNHMVLFLTAAKCFISKTSNWFPVSVSFLGFWKPWNLKTRRPSRSPERNSYSR